MMTVDEVSRKLDGYDNRKKLELYSTIALGKKDLAILTIQERTGCEYEDALQVYEIRHEEYLERERQRKARIAEEKQKYIPKCPTCGSPDIKKITGGKRWVTTGIFGLGSSNLGKTMECNNCGYKW